MGRQSTFSLAIERLICRASIDDAFATSLFAHKGEAGWLEARGLSAEEAALVESTSRESLEAIMTAMAAQTPDRRAFVRSLALATVGLGVGVGTSSCVGESYASGRGAGQSGGPTDVIVGDGSGLTTANEGAPVEAPKVPWQPSGDKEISLVVTGCSVGPTRYRVTLSFEQTAGSPNSKVSIAPLYMKVRPKLELCATPFEVHGIMVEVTLAIGTEAPCKVTGLATKGAVPLPKALETCIEKAIQSTEVASDVPGVEGTLLIVFDKKGD